MRDLHELDRWRLRLAGPYGAGDGTCGAFQFPDESGRAHLRVVASSDAGWDHVSVSLERRCPTWAEMDGIKRQFFRPDEVVMQLHPAESDHINCHPYCLHLWRPHDGAIPLPPTWMIA